MLFEMAGVPQDVAYEAMKKASYKLPIKTKFISKGGIIYVISEFLRT